MVVYFIVDYICCDACNRYVAKWHVAQTGSFLLHLSMLAILGGGLLTWLMQEKGSVRISQGERVAFFEREGVE